MTTTAATLAFLAAGCASDSSGRFDDTVGLDETTTSEVESLVHMREEEKLARDVYTALGERWDLPIFHNIAESEQRHMDAVLVLLDERAIPDPAAGKGPGDFSDPDFGSLYATLTSRGAESLESALAVGATIEDLDLAGLEREASEHEDDAQIVAVYENLARGSRNHLRAFSSRLADLGVTYEPVYISAADYAAILASPHESGPGSACRGSCGQGAGCRCALP